MPAGNDDVHSLVVFDAEKTKLTSKISQKIWTKSKPTLSSVHLIFHLYLTHRNKYKNLRASYQCVMWAGQ